jgi:hypothetical protein
MRHVVNCQESHMTLTATGTRAPVLVHHELLGTNPALLFGNAASFTE